MQGVVWGNEGHYHKLQKSETALQLDVSFVEFNPPPGAYSQQSSKKQNALDSVVSIGFMEGDQLYRGGRLIAWHICAIVCEN